jgi:Zn-dependent M28 family amino/carboxypeptidase
MKGIKNVIFFFFLAVGCQAQKKSEGISLKELERIENFLASDELRGRKAGTPEIDKAADFIAEEFRKAGLKPFGKESFLQSFTLPGGSPAGMELRNVVGILPGKSRSNEYVIFSAHYDHIGTGRPIKGDSIYNGANDNAAGTAAVILLANHFKKANNNERTLVFAAFTAEESGGHGSEYFSKQLDPSKVVAMFNIEMIGTESKWGKNSAFITGYDLTNMGSIMQKNLSGSAFTFHPDPYPELGLFYRSDNATLARLGVPAHTISTSKMDNEPYYHKPGDEVKTLDLANMAEIIRAIAISAGSIVNGKDTPDRTKIE